MLKFLIEYIKNIVIPNKKADVTESISNFYNKKLVKKEEISIKEDLLHAPLLNEIKKFENVILPAERIIYHGSREFSPETDYAGRALLGTRKWFSDDQAYAVNYAFCDRHIDLGRPLLWKCKIKTDVTCLKGSQFSLVNYSPWGAAFPYKFPDDFYKYARSIQGEQKSFVLLDHLKNDLFREILIAFQDHVIEILDVFILPDDKPTAIKYASTHCV